MKEKYYAVKIGKVPLNRPYFTVGPDGKTPALFCTRKEAKAKSPGRPTDAVVRVVITTTL